MKTNKKGISLIVLVITIIVIIILAAAVILTLNNNNPIENATKATYANDKAEIHSALVMYISNYMMKNNGNSPFAAGSTVPITGTTTTTDPATGYVTSLGWGTAGIGVDKPTLVDTAKINADTGVITFTSTNNKLNKADVPNLD